MKTSVNGMVSWFATLTGSVVAVASCSNSSPATDAGNDAGPAMCANPGEATPGPADNHCQGQPVQVVNPASCHPDAGTQEAGADDAGDAGDMSDAGPVDTCDFGDTMFGMEGDDDDCKYHVSWTSTPICEGAGGVIFTVTVINLTDNSPVADVPCSTCGPLGGPGYGIIVEPFIPTVADAACDDMSTHPSPSDGAFLVETAAGSGVYVGPVVFDAPGDWTLRFHVHEECSDLLDDSPHGHAAFHINVP